MGPGLPTSDTEQILAHLHGLFAAFIRQNREAIRRGHTADWRGFLVRSPRLLRGIDEYMRAADEALRRFRGTRYELIEHELVLHGDLAIVFYVARYWHESDDGRELELPLRSVDIYRREGGGWNQCGSNICVVPSE